MRKANKSSDSEVLQKGLKYANKTDRGEIRNILTSEQGGFCAYTDKRLGVGYKGEIEHFNPILKATEEDSYYNWYVCHGDWNRRKGSQPNWDKHQPVLSPYADDFENRIRCDLKDMMYVHDKADALAENLIKYLKLNDHALAGERQAYVRRIQYLKGAIAPQDLKEFLREDENRGHIEFPRFLKEIFGIDISAI